MKTKNKKTLELFVRAGKYWITDPCLIVKDNEDWWKICDSFSQEDSVSVELKSGFMVHAFDVGDDGCYMDQNSTEYYVDSGTIGLVSYEHDTNYDPIRMGGRLVEFAEDTMCFCEDDFLTFGKIYIDLNPENEYSFETEND